MGINNVPTALNGLTAKSRQIPQEVQHQAMREAQDQVSRRILNGEKLTPEQRSTAERQTYQAVLLSLLAGRP